MQIQLIQRQNSNSIVKSVVEERKANRDVDSKNVTEKNGTTESSTEVSKNNSSNVHANSALAEINSTGQESATSPSSATIVKSSAMTASSSSLEQVQSSSSSHSQSLSNEGSSAISKAASVSDEKSGSNSQIKSKAKIAKVAAVGARAKAKDSTKLVKKNGRVYRYNTQTNQYVTGFYTDNNQNKTYYYDPASAMMVVGQKKINNY
ncbi:hypothetical protein KCA1_0977 [Lactiplantibacillus pentosus KCA1]|nr:hypothetical protein [Lactiplantibacillus pentosus]EIW14419.1 hypothetical protein KCA1_0977 [Lactiplantibacillus pentosus KCA1]